MHGEDRNLGQVYVQIVDSVLSRFSKAYILRCRTTANDLRQIGLMTLVEVAPRHDPRMKSLRDFASTHIYWAMRREINRSRSMISASPGVYRVFGRMRRHGAVSWNESVVQEAKGINLSKDLLTDPNTHMTYLSWLCGFRSIYTDQQKPLPCDGGTTKPRFIVDALQSPDVDLDEEIDRQRRLHVAVGLLRQFLRGRKNLARDEAIMYERILAPKGEETTLSDLESRLGVTRQRVHQIEKSLRADFQAFLEKEGVVHEHE